MNYFSIFDLSVHYQIDIKKLDDKFYSLQRKYHPDKFVSSSQKEQLIALQKSSIVNQAWQTLRNPLKRAEYLLSLYGFNISNNHIIHDSVFLVEQISLREELDIIKQEQNIVLLKAFIHRIQEKLNLLYKKMQIEFTNKAMNNIADIIYKLRFLDKLRHLAEQLEDKLLDL